MQILILVLLMLLLQVSTAAAQNAKPLPPSPIRGITDESWWHLTRQIAKGEDRDDPAKMVGFWAKIVSSTFGHEDRSELEFLANRRPTRKLIGPDGELYMTVFAGLLLALDQEKQKEATTKAALEAVLKEATQLLVDLKKERENLVQLQQKYKATPDP
ncbi:MAG TPA: hypothetical protein VD998_04330 [Verrucomicrobiae bacterium]|nr:hypothetical protein [Verrucomicrobiae bacterium]